MKTLHWFYLGAGVDVLAILVALFFILSDRNSISGGTNNPEMHRAVLTFSGWVGIAFLINWLGHQTLAATMLWIPGTALLGYGLMILLFMIFQPRF